MHVWDGCDLGSPNWSVINLMRRRMKLDCYIDFFFDSKKNNNTKCRVGLEVTITAITVRLTSTVEAMVVVTEAIVIIITIGVTLINPVAKVACKVVHVVVRKRNRDSETSGTEVSTETSTEETEVSMDSEGIGTSTEATETLTDLSDRGSFDYEEI